MFSKKPINYIYNSSGTIVSVIDKIKLKKFISGVVSQEFSNMVEDCYYPKISNIYKELLHLTNSNEIALKQYSQEKYKNPEWKLIHDPQTTIIVLITQEFLKDNDIAAAMTTFHLFALRYYSNLMHSSIRYCNADYFRTAMNSLSQRHLFVSKKTIGSSVLYLSQEVFKRYHTALSADDSPLMIKMIMELRHRISQSTKSFASKYYEASTSKETISSDEEEHETMDSEKRNLASRLAKDICIFGKISPDIVSKATDYTKFNRKIALEYAESIAQSKYYDVVNMIFYLIFKNLSSFEILKTTDFIIHIKQMMAIKVSKQPVFFKKSVIELHDSIIIERGYRNWFNALSDQSKATSRNFIAYYLAFYCQNYL